MFKSRVPIRVHMSDTTYYETGSAGVTKMEEIEIRGPSGKIPYIRIFGGHKQVHEIPKHATTVVTYKTL